MCTHLSPVLTVAALIVSDHSLVSGVRGVVVTVVAGGAGHSLLLVPAPAQGAAAGFVSRHQKLVRNVIMSSAG